MQKCIENVGTWMGANKLKMNEDKTEVMAISTDERLRQLQVSSIEVSGCTIRFAESVRNLGVFLDKTLSMDAHVKFLSRVLNFQLKRLSKLRPFLTTDAANKLALAFILSRLDFCNSLFAGMTESNFNKLQRIQNNAARIVLRKSRRDRSVPLLRSLHWLPVRARVEYKICTFCHQHVHCPETLPSYISALINPYQPNRDTRSMTAKLLEPKRYNLKTFGKRSFSVFAPTLWKTLPLDLRLNPCLSSFKRQLKTHLFTQHLS